MTKRIQICTGTALMTILLVFATSSAWAKSPILKNWRGLAVKGYDVVAYFEEGRPVKGSKTFAYKWKDATWQFSSEARLSAFKAEPEKYAPQYGGY